MVAVAISSASCGCGVLFLRGCNNDSSDTSSETSSVEPAAPAHFIISAAQLGKPDDIIQLRTNFNNRP
jgi:hypothetical protein